MSFLDVSTHVACLYSIYMDDEDPNKSFARLQSFDLDDLDDVVGCTAGWFEDVEKLAARWI